MICVLVYLYLYIHFGVLLSARTSIILIIYTSFDCLFCRLYRLDNYPHQSTFRSGKIQANHAPGAPMQLFESFLWNEMSQLSETSQMWCTYQGSCSNAPQLCECSTGFMSTKKTHRHCVNFATFCLHKLKYRIRRVDVSLKVWRLMEI